MGLQELEKMINTYLNDIVSFGEEDEYDNAKEMWKGCYEDLQTCVAYQPWFKIPEEWK